MQCCVSYSGRRHDSDRGYQSQQELSPYDDWLRRGSPQDALFAFPDRYGPDKQAIAYLRPAQRILFVDADMEYYTYLFTATYGVDGARKTVRLDRLLCNIFNTNGGPRDEETGGVALYKAMQKRGVGEKFDVSFERSVKRFFGREWTGILPLTRPKISDADLALAAECHGMYWGAVDAPSPCGKVVGFFSFVRADAALTIQRHFRGWRARLATTFNPHTRIGKYYLLRSFAALKRLDAVDSRPPL